MALPADNFNILVAIDETPDPEWEQIRPLGQLSFVREGREAYHALTGEHFDLVFIDLSLSGMDGLELLRRNRGEKLCGSIILTSSFQSFSYAQQGILYGVDAYLLRPLDMGEVAAAIRRIQSTVHTPDARLSRAVRQTWEQLQTPQASQAFLSAGQALCAECGDALKQSFRWREFYTALVDRTYTHFPWLKLYLHPEEFSTLDFVHESDSRMVVNFCQRKLTYLSQVLQELFPATSNPGMQDIMTFLLQAVDQNIPQKEVAGRYFITGSTLSTRFQRGLGITYREYMTRLKMRRGLYLLRHTDTPPETLAALLGYRDSEYFARLFHQRTGLLLQEQSRRNRADYVI